MKNNMKKFLLLFCMLACVFCITACGSTKKTTAVTTKSLEYDITSLQSSSQSLLQGLSDATDAALNDSIMNSSSMTEGYQELYTNWMNSREELGTFVGITDFTATSDKESVTMTITAQYSNREAGVEITLDSTYDITSSVFNPVYTTGEKMEKAVLNTLIGMGTVFIVLIFISFIISCFKYINQFEAKMKAKKEDNTVEQAVDNAIAQIVQNESEDESDNLELAAVIAAAIAAYEGTSADGLVVRSIKKVNKRR